MPKHADLHQAGKHGGPGDNVPTLQDCRLQRVTGDDIVLMGAEWVGIHHECRRAPQAWCRCLVADGGGEKRKGV